MKEIKITEEQARQMYDSGIESLKSIAQSNFPELFHQEKKWEDFGEIEGFYIDGDDGVILSYKSLESSSKNINIYPTETEAARELALIQLRQWRDKANGQPLADWCDWSNENQCKYCIKPIRKSWISDDAFKYRHELAFKTREIRNQFVKDHKSLIDKAFNL